MHEKTLKLLVVDDDPSMITVLEAGLSLLPDLEITASLRASEALALLRSEPYDMLIADYSLGDPAINGLTLLGVGQQQAVKPLTIIITAYASLEISLQSIQLGAHDFLIKPFQMEQLQLIVRNGADVLRVRQENAFLKEQIAEMMRSFVRLDQEHAALQERIAHLSGGTNDPSGTDPGLIISPGLDVSAMQEMRRRRMRDQVNSYQRMSETLAEQLTRERQRIESLVQIGLIPQNAFERALREGRFETDPLAEAPKRETQG